MYNSKSYRVNSAVYHNDLERYRIFTEYVSIKLFIFACRITNRLNEFWIFIYIKEAEVTRSYQCQNSYDKDNVHDDNPYNGRDPW